MAQALVSTHDYAKAIDYYEQVPARCRTTPVRAVVDSRGAWAQAVSSSPEAVSLRSDLARLYLDLGRFGDASRYWRRASAQYCVRLCV